MSKINILTKAEKKISRLGLRGQGVFLGNELKALGWKLGQKITVVSYTKSGKKGIIIEKK